MLSVRMFWEQVAVTDLLSKDELNPLQSRSIFWCSEDCFVKFSSPHPACPPSVLLSSPQPISVWSVVWQQLRRVAPQKPINQLTGGLYTRIRTHTQTHTGWGSLRNACCLRLRSQLVCLQVEPINNECINNRGRANTVVGECLDRDWLTFCWRTWKAGEIYSSFTFYFRVLVFVQVLVDH